MQATKLSRPTSDRHTNAAVLPHTHQKQTGHTPIRTQFPREHGQSCNKAALTWLAPAEEEEPMLVRR